MDDNAVLKETLRKAWFHIKEIESMMAAYEVAYFNFEVTEAEFSRRDAAEFMFFGILHLVKDMTDDLEKYVIDPAPDFTELHDAK